VPIIDREDAIQTLNRLSEPGRRAMALLYGRRRVGKTYLLTNLWARERGFYFTASATTP
jgi:AAA+ ATPase superfamily predicted ATPase